MQSQAVAIGPGFAVESRAGAATVRPSLGQEYVQGVITRR